jgi:hypothetical protein
MIFKKAILILALLTSAVTVSFANSPGGGYIQCDPRNPNSPVRCTPDGCQPADLSSAENGLFADKRSNNYSTIAPQRAMLASGSESWSWP